MKKKGLLCLLMYIFMGFALASATEPEKRTPPGTTTSAAKGTITGVVKLESGEAPSGMIAFFDAEEGLPPGPGSGRRIPDMKTKLQADGTFVANIQPGNYYIGVILGREKERVGPPSKSERSFVAYGEGGKPRIFLVESGEINQVGFISGQIPELEKLPQPEGQFMVKGKVLDVEGKPVKGIKVIAVQIDPDGLRPVYTSLDTEDDGAYLLHLNAKNEYYISGRSGLGGGQPEPGELIGRYGGGKARVVHGKPGEVVAGIDIEVFTIPERGESGKKALKKPKDVASPQQETLREE